MGFLARDIKMMRRVFGAWHGYHGSDSEIQVCSSCGESLHAFNALVRKGN